jgi:hypothetical protein
VVERRPRARALIIRITWDLLAMIDRTTDLHDGEPRPDIACPACGYVPTKGATWHCSPDGCGAFFDTFETHARCPQCEAQFAWTGCPACGKASAHRAWYRQPRN